MGESAGATTARAKALREDLLEAANAKNKAVVEAYELRDAISSAESDAKEAAEKVRSYSETAAAAEAEAGKLRAQASQDPRDAEDLMERAAVFKNTAKFARDKAKLEVQSAERHTAEVARLKAEETAQTKRVDELGDKFRNAEAAIDTLENKARILSEAETKETEAADLEKQAAVEDDPATAAQLRQDAEGARIVAEAGRQNAAEMKIDEQAIKDAGLKDPGTAPDPDALMDPNDMDTASFDSTAPAGTSLAAAPGEPTADGGSVGDEGEGTATMDEPGVPAASVATLAPPEPAQDTYAEADSDYGTYSAEADSGDAYAPDDTYAQVDAQPEPEEMSVDSDGSGESDEWTA